MEGISKEVKNEPEFKRKVGQFEITAWRKEIEKGGRKFPVRNFCLSKSWKDQDGNWKDRKLYFDLNDIARMMLLLRVLLTWHLENPAKISQGDQNEKESVEAPPI